VAIEGLYYTTAAANPSYNSGHFTGATMEFTALFLVVTVVMIVAWHGPRPLALTLFAVVLLASVATYLHHATDTLTLSF
jgi:hypothetical protein